MKKWTKKCKCGNFISDEYELCDYCLLQKYREELDFPISSYGYFDNLYRCSNVVKALRKAEKHETD